MNSSQEFYNHFHGHWANDELKRNAYLVPEAYALNINMVDHTPILIADKDDPDYYKKISLYWFGVASEIVFADSKENHELKNKIDDLKALILEVVEDPEAVCTLGSDLSNRLLEVNSVD
jgi:hypothetical protein